MKTHSLVRTIPLILIILSSILFNGFSDQVQSKKIGVLLVNHGSRSSTWRKALLALEDSVRENILKNKTIHAIKTAHMEYTEPSIATMLKEFDSEGFTDVIIIPIFLTVSPHTFDDIPTIIGQKEDPTSLQLLKIEKIERYIPKAKTYLAPNLDFSNVLKLNILRRVQSLSKKPSEEGFVMIGYGDETYEKEWSALFDDVAGFIKQQTGISAASHGWCGHLVHYNPEKTTEAIEKVLLVKKTALVIPVLVAQDEMFQVNIIGDGVVKLHEYKTRVRYKPDSILPDENIQRWILKISNDYVKKAQDNLADIKK